MILMWFSVFYGLFPVVGMLVLLAACGLFSRRR